MLEAGQVVIDRTLAELEAAGDLPLRQLEIVVQPQHVVNLTHGDSLSGHPFIRGDDPFRFSSATTQFSTGRFQMIPITVFTDLFG